MGISLIFQALAAAGPNGLNAKEVIVLALMAGTALDTPSKKGQPPGLYFGGWEHLAVNLGWDPDHPKTYERVRRITKSLRNKGLIEAMHDHPRTGTRQCYRLTMRGVAHLAVGETCPPESGGAVPPRIRGGTSPHESVSSAPPNPGGPRKELGEGAGQKTQDPTHSTALSYGYARETTDKAIESQSEVGPHEHRGAPGDDCEDCGRGYANRLHIEHRRRSA